MDYPEVENLQYFENFPNKKIEVINIDPADVESIFRVNELQVFSILKDGTYYFVDSDYGYFSCNKQFDYSIDETSSQIKIQR